MGYAHLLLEKVAVPVRAPSLQQIGGTEAAAARRGAGCRLCSCHPVVGRGCAGRVSRRSRPNRCWLCSRTCLPCRRGSRWRFRPGGWLRPWYLWGRPPRWSADTTSGCFLVEIFSRKRTNRLAGLSFGNCVRVIYLSCPMCPSGRRCVSFRPTVRLNTILSGVESLSTLK